MDLNEKFRKLGFSYKYFSEKHKINERTLSKILNLENNQIEKYLNILKDLEITPEEYLKMKKKRDD